MARLLRYFVVSLLVLFIVISLLVWIFSPMLARYFITDNLKANYQLSLSSDSSIRVNPFISKVTISDLAISTEQNKKSTRAR